MPAELRNEDSGDPFPVGMRVLAVDDDLLCLKVLDTLLRKCQYHVTTTSQAVMALKLLRENKDKFDLVISDVQMPDMDGFKLLELVGLEMDLPVIMLSSYGDTKLVMKGITHGACDYLLKPVRLEELKNIWQHVVRRRKANSKDISNNRDNKSCGSRERNKLTGLGSYEQNAKMNRKRKDQNEGDEEEYDENGSDNDDMANQKKSRVVWSVELHRKFVAAVHALGFDKAVPKKILELMNVDNLTRENVASHLQKYRLYLKRLNAVANQQANMVAALGNADSVYLSMGAASFHDFNRSLQLQNSTLGSIPSPGPRAVGTLKTAADLVGLHGMSPSGMIPSAQAHRTPRSSINGSTLLLEDQAGKVLEGMPTSLEFGQLQHEDNTNPQELIVARGNDMNFMKSTSDNVINGSRNFLRSGNNSVVLDGNPQDSQTRGALVNRTLVANLSDSRICNGNWASSVPSSAAKSTSFTLDGGYLTTFEPVVSQRESSSLLLSDHAPFSPPLHGSRLDVQCMAQEISRAPRHGWDKHRLNVFLQRDFSDGSTNSCVTVHGASPPCSQGIGFNRIMDSNLMGHPGLDPISRQQGYVYAPMEHGRAFGGYSGNGSGFLEDIVTAVVKRV